MENYCEFVKFSLNFDTLVTCPNTFFKQGLFYTYALKQKITMIIFAGISELVLQHQSSSNLSVGLQNPLYLHQLI